MTFLKSGRPYCMGSSTRLDMVDWQRRLIRTMIYDPKTAHRLLLLILCFDQSLCLLGTAQPSFCPSMRNHVASCSGYSFFVCVYFFLLSFPSVRTNSFFLFLTCNVSGLFSCARCASSIQCVAMALHCQPPYCCFFMYYRCLVFL